jgi:multidrug efflux system membrane fusion protein
MRHARAAAYAAIGIVIVGAAVAWRFDWGSKAKTQSTAQETIPVTAGNAVARNVPDFIEGLGAVQAFNRVNVTSRVNGEITQVLFREGQEVKAGDKLFQIDPRQFNIALEQAEATKEKDEAQLQSAQLDLQRYSQLLPQGFQTRQSYDQQRATVGQLQATIKVDQAQIENAQINLDYALIRSPIAGRTGQRVVDVGNVVQTGQNSSLVTITQLKPIFVSFNVPAEQLDVIRKNQAQHPLKVIAYAMDDQTVLSDDGQLTLIDNQVDTTTGTIHLKAQFPNGNEALWPGQSVNAHLVLSTREDAVTVPAQTVMQGPNGPYVYVLDNDIAKRRSVSVAATQDGFAVIAKGLKAGERVVVEGQYRLTDGSKVKIGAQAASSAEQAQR